LILSRLEESIVMQSRRKQRNTNRCKDVMSDKMNITWICASLCYSELAILYLLRRAENGSYEDSSLLISHRAYQITRCYPRYVLILPVYFVVYSRLIHWNFRVLEFESPSLDACIRKLSVPLARPVLGAKQA